MGYHIHYFVILPGSRYHVTTLAEGGLTTVKSFGLITDLGGILLTIGNVWFHMHMYHLPKPLRAELLRRSSYQSIGDDCYL